MINMKHELILHPTVNNRFDSPINSVNSFVTGCVSVTSAEYPESDGTIRRERREWFCCSSYAVLLCEKKTTFNENFNILQ